MKLKYCLREEPRPPSITIGLGAIIKRINTKTVKHAVAANKSSLKVLSLLNL